MILKKMIIILLCMAGIQGDCNICQSTNNVACHKENQYSLCIEDVPTEDFITCPENHVCTPDPYVCYHRSIAKSSCTCDKNLCGVCSENKVYACINETTIAFCYGKDKPIEGAEVSYCLGTTVCDIDSVDGFCTESRLTKPSCITDSDNDVPNVTEPTNTTIEALTSPTESITANESIETSSLITDPTTTELTIATTDDKTTNTIDFVTTTETVNMITETTNTTIEPLTTTKQQTTTEPISTTEKEYTTGTIEPVTITKQPTITPETTTTRTETIPITTPLTITTEPTTTTREFTTGTKEPLPIITTIQTTTTRTEATSITEPLTTTTTQATTTITEYTTTTTESTATTTELTTNTAQLLTTKTSSTPTDFATETIELLTTTTKPTITTTEPNTTQNTSSAMDNAATTTELTTTIIKPTVPSLPREPNTICRDAASTGSFYADDPTCTTFIMCYVFGASLAGIRKSCQAGQYFPPGATYCSDNKPDVCVSGQNISIINVY